MGDGVGQCCAADTVQSGDVLQSKFTRDSLEKEGVFRSKSNYRLSMIDNIRSLDIQLASLSSQKCWVAGDFMAYDRLSTKSDLRSVEGMPTGTAMAMEDSGVNVPLETNSVNDSNSSTLPEMMPSKMIPPAQRNSQKSIKSKSK